MRSTSDSGRKLRRYTPRVATVASVENAITGTPRWRAAEPTTPTECANNGPMMISAPSASACWAACWAPPEVPPSSFTRSWTLGLLNSASAISPAFFIDSATVPALPPADNGRIRATRTAPVPISLDCTGGGAVPGAGFLLNTSEIPEQPARMANAPASTAAPKARRGTGCIGAREAGIMDDVLDSKDEPLCQSTLANGHNEDHRLTKWKG